ncbi:hypothetical protein FS749_001841 [Ceratobasidium sp. UAMH 11750]|nr:hypothetical protein FS749_001841 [Ceratobasidium sp. UAMH 11750]
MLFSRILVAAVTFIGAAHALSLNPPSHRPHQHTPRDAPAVSAAVTPLVDATNKLHALRTQVGALHCILFLGGRLMRFFATAAAMAGPQEDREAKFVSISGQALQITKDCNAALKSQSAWSKLADTDTSDQMAKFSRAMFRVIRSCKGIRNTQIADNIDQIMDQMEAIQATVQGIIPSLVASLLQKFNINLGRLSSIHAAVAW